MGMGHLGERAVLQPAHDAWLAVGAPWASSPHAATAAVLAVLGAEGNRDAASWYTELVGASALAFRLQVSRDGM